MRRGLQRADRCDQLQPRAHGALCVVLVCLGITKVDQHPVAHVLRYEATKATNGLRNALLVGRNDLAQIFRVGEPDKSENITVTWRRSARSSGCVLGARDMVVVSADGALPLASPRRAAMASRSFTR